LYFDADVKPLLLHLPYPPVWKTSKQTPMFIATEKQQPMEGTGISMD
jgi:hypothetical protein